MNVTMVGDSFRSFEDLIQYMPAILRAWRGQSRHPWIGPTRRSQSGTPAGSLHAF